MMKGYVNPFAPIEFTPYPWGDTHLPGKKMPRCKKCGGFQHGMASCPVDIAEARMNPRPLTYEDMLREVDARQEHNR